jgi:hypothetical protein
MDQYYHRLLRPIRQAPDPTQLSTKTSEGIDVARSGTKGPVNQVVAAT